MLAPTFISPMTARLDVVGLALFAWAAVAIVLAAVAVLVLARERRSTLEVAAPSVVPPGNHLDRAA
jgi:hypothetical protein